MKVNIRLEDGTETVVDAVGEITLEYGHAGALSFGNRALFALTRHGLDDWEVHFPDIDFSVRGSQADILKEIKYTMDCEEDKGGN